MKIAVMGAGAIGSLVGYFLQKSGQDVILVDPYAEHMRVIREEGLHIVTSEGDLGRFKIPTCCDAESAGPCDMVIVLVKAYLTRSAIRQMSALFREDTIVCTLQNGLGTEQALLEEFPAERVFYGCLKFNSRITAPGEILADIKTRPGYMMTFGATDLGSPYVPAVRELAEKIDANCFAAAFVEDIDTHIWKKAINNVACNSLCGILRLTGGQMYDHPASRAILEATIREIVAVAAAKGVDLGDPDEILAGYAEYPIKNIRNHYPSTAQDMIGKKRTEIEFLNGAVVRYGKALGVPTPVNELLANLVSAIQDNYENQAF